MFTIKLFDPEKGITRLVEAESVAIERNQDNTIINLAVRRPGGGEVFVLGSPAVSRDEPSWKRAIIENANGRTTEILNPSTVSATVAAASKVA